MGDGCTDCGRKGGCDHRKGDMFAAMDEALARLYPTRRWGERRRAGRWRPRGGVPARPGESAGRPAGRAAEHAGRASARRPGRDLRLHLRAVPGPHAPPCSRCARAWSLPRRSDRRRQPRPWRSCTCGWRCRRWPRLRRCSSCPCGRASVTARRWIEEAQRAGVFDPVLLPRFRTLVAVLTELGLRHLDFGEISEAPAGLRSRRLRRSLRRRPGAGQLPLLSAAGIEYHDHRAAARPAQPPAVSSNLTT